MNGKVFGQIGMGNIAQRVARIMHNGFGCKVLGYDPFISAEDAAARGGVADEDALYDCLVSGQLRGAACCDTFADGEPVSPDHKLLTLRNFSATPHLGGNTEEALQKTGMQIVKDTLAYLNGEGGYHQVNKF